MSTSWPVDVLVFLPPWVSHSHHSPSVCRRIYISTALSQMCPCESLYTPLSPYVSWSLGCSHSKKYYCFFHFCLSHSVFFSIIFLSLYISVPKDHSLCQFVCLHCGHWPFSFSPTPPILPLFIIPSMSTLLSPSIHIPSLGKLISLPVWPYVCFTVSLFLSPHAYLNTLPSFPSLYACIMSCHRYVCVFVSMTQHAWLCLRA